MCVCVCKFLYFQWEKENILKGQDNPIYNK